MKEEKTLDKKTFSLSKEEQVSLKGMQQVMNYICSLVQDDMALYIDSVVKARLGIPREQIVTFDINLGIIQLEPEKKESIDKK